MEKGKVFYCRCKKRAAYIIKFIDYMDNMKTGCLLCDDCLDHLIDDLSLEVVECRDID